MFFEACSFKLVDKFPKVEAPHSYLIFEIPFTCQVGSYERIKMQSGGNGISVRMIIVHRSFMYLPLVVLLDLKHKNMTV